MNRLHWQTLAEERIIAAQALLNAQNWSSAYYLAGYAVEFGLKSCILVHVANTGAIFENKNFSKDCWTHAIKDLVRLAGLVQIQQNDNKLNALLEQNWIVVCQWTEESRYQQKTQFEAQELFSAITHNVNGVMPWIRSHW